MAIGSAVGDANETATNPDIVIDGNVLEGNYGDAWIIAGSVSDSTHCPAGS
jgi:hypothetical protein